MHFVETYYAPAVFDIYLKNLTLDFAICSGYFFCSGLVYIRALVEAFMHTL